MIYFDNNKNAYGYEIENPICVIEDFLWVEYAGTDKWDIIDGIFTDITDTEEYQAEQVQKERERIAKLFLTGADVERGIYQAKGLDFEDIVAMVTQIQPQDLDIKALKIELKANNFYRGNPYVTAVGALLGFTSEQLDRFFETNDYTVLLPPVVEETTEEPVVEENSVVEEVE